MKARNDMGNSNAADIAADMRRQIEGGHYRQYDRLPPSRQLAESMGIARNTLREAIYRLQKEGLLETRPGSGTYIVTDEDDPVPPAVSETSPLELIDSRFALEPHICRLCVLKAPRESFQQMELLCRKMEGAVNDPVVFAEADADFHSALASATGNKMLIWLIKQINTVRRLDEWNMMRQLTLDADMITHYNAQHREILAAVKSRQAEAAAIAMKEHLETARLSLTRAAEA